MKAIRVRTFGPPDVLRLEDVPGPTPGAGQVLVRVHAAGVNPVDTYIRAGTYGTLPPLPYTPGMDAAGVVVAVGPGTDGIDVGDRVWTGRSISGTYAEMVLCDAAQVHPLPARLGYAQGAAIHVPYATAWRALHQRAKARPGEWVLIHGASGGVGLAAVQVARAAGLRVIGTAGTPRGLDLVREHGAHHALSHHDPGSLDRIREITGHPQGGVDVVIEMLANENLQKDLEFLASGGRIVVVGSRGPVEITPRAAMARDAAILGMMLFNATPAETREVYAALDAGLENGTLTPVVGREFALAHAAKAHELVMQPGAHGKIVLIS